VQKKLAVTDVPSAAGFLLGDLYAQHKANDTAEWVPAIDCKCSTLCAVGSTIDAFKTVKTFGFAKDENVSHWHTELARIFKECAVDVNALADEAVTSIRHQEGTHGVHPTDIEKCVFNQNAEVFPDAIPLKPLLVVQRCGYWLFEPFVYPFDGCNLFFTVFTGIVAAFILPLPVITRHGFENYWAQASRDKSILKDCSTVIICAGQSVFVPFGHSVVTLGLYEDPETMIKKTGMPNEWATMLMYPILSSAVEPPYYIRAGRRLRGALVEICFLE